ncbi:4'-phosphopantetheinyl transferase superfamily protein [Streptomyces sp. NPDC006283]|uniref:4'-phosphopantetheinyl transferase family protein n=1 Tax=Streptomyces sp. NPDC006283 TaxID=3156741 RepID=UPI0033BA5DA0
MSATAAGPDTVQLWFCLNEALDEATSTLLAGHWLDEHEREIAGRFLFERDRRQYLVAHALVRRVLSLETGIPEAEATIWRSSRGRPFLQTPPASYGRPGAGDTELDFNLSHAHGCNVVAVTRGRRVGVDVERLDRGAERGLDWIVESFAPEERAYLTGIGPGSRRDRATLRLWTLKEAYAKARGLGLGLPFDSFAFELAEDRGVVGFRPPEGDSAERWLFAELEPRPQVLVSLAVEKTAHDAAPPARLLIHDGFPWGRAAPREVALPAGHHALPALAGSAAH